MSVSSLSTSSLSAAAAASVAATTAEVKKLQFVDVTAAQAVESKDAKASSEADPSNAVVRVRKSADRGHADHGWLNSRFSFSFAGYYQPKFTDFHSLRVINEDRVAPSEGFPSHPHSNYEIFSYIVRGALRHRDNMGNVETLPRGFVQFTSAGTGIVHSEFNASDKQGDYVHFIQMWVKPSRHGLRPNYQTKSWTDADKQGQLRLILAPTESKEGQAGSAIAINQDVRVYASLLKNGESATLDVGDDREVYVHVIMDTTSYDTEADKTAITVNGTRLAGGDGAFISRAKSGEKLRLTFAGANSDGKSNAEFIVFDLKKTASR